MLPFYQGKLDSLCGIYSIVNADRVINKTSQDNAQQLFAEIVRFLSRKRLLVDILTDGMRLKVMTMILDKVIGDRIQNKE